MGNTTNTEWWTDKICRKVKINKYYWKKYLNKKNLKCMKHTKRKRQNKTVIQGPKRN